MSLLQQVETAIRRGGLIQPGDHVLAAVSGGSDSMALLYLLHALSLRHDFTLSVVHVHHGLRGADADADAVLVKQTAWTLGRMCHERRVKVRDHAGEHGLSVEMAARRLRHQVFAEVAQECSAASVALAHHLQDQAETMVLRLARGAGLDGLCGMDARQDFTGWTAIRPLLGCHKMELQNFLVAHRCPWREDATNQDHSALRNRVRHQILPVLRERLNPRMDEALARTADILREERLILDARTDEVMKALPVDGAGGLDAPGLQQVPVADRRRVVMRWLNLGGVEGSTLTLDAVDRVIELVGGPGDGRVDLPGGHHVVLEGQRLRLDPRRKVTAPFDLAVPVPGSVMLPGLGLIADVAPATGFDRTPGEVGRFPSQAYFAQDALAGRSVRLRSWRPGDRYQPLGMSGTIKIQDLFVNAKVPRAARRGIPVLEVDGRVAWVSGHRVAAGFEVKGSDPPSFRLRIEQIP